MRIVTFTALASTVFFTLFVAANAYNKSKEDLWLDTHDAREIYFEGAVGPVPKGIIRIPGTKEVWPGGGLLVIPAPQSGTRPAGTDMTVYTTSGFTNLDMPADLRMVGFKLGPDGVQAGGQLEKKTPAPRRPEAAGYGYELMVIAPKNKDWPLSLLKWAVNEELSKDTGFLDKVEKQGGLTVEQIDVGESERINILVSKAVSPLPTGTQLPAGKMEMLVATAITPEEMRWSREHGQGALLQKLREAGIGQASMLGRESVVR